MTDTQIKAVLIGTPRGFGPKGQPSTIAGRYPVSGPVAVGPDGLAGDAVGDPRFHGGPEKAIHHYPRDHYAAWIEDLAPAPAILGEVGAFGENLSTEGLTESAVCIGDVFRAGTAVLQISQARQPCWKLNVRFGRKDMAKRVQNTGRTGWYYRVLEPGEVAPHDSLVLLDRPQPAWTLARILEVLYLDPLNADALAAIAAIPELSESWRRLATRRLETHRVEDWSARLETSGA